MIPVDQIGELLDAWSANVAASRNRQGLAPLTDEGGRFGVGQEAIFAELDAPRIVLVPTGLSDLKHKQRMPNPPTHTMADNQPKVLWASWLGFNAYLWGDEWPGDTPKPIWWDFNTSLELFRELSMALYRTVTGPSIRMNGASWEQPTDQARRGRWLVADFAIEFPVCDEPYVMLPYGAHPDVEINLNTNPTPPTPPIGEIVIPS